MNTPVFVAGTGVISAIGNNRAACISALENGQAGMGEQHDGGACQDRQSTHEADKLSCLDADILLSSEDIGECVADD